MVREDGRTAAYALDNVAQSMNWYEKAASTPEGKEMLALNGTVDCLLFVYTEDNDLGTIIPSSEKNAMTFGGTGPIFPSGGTKTNKEMAETIECKLEHWKRQCPGNPRFIVSSEREQDFLAVAKLLELDPLKTSESYFSSRVKYEK